MRRREFITLLGGAAAWPLAARAQQPAMPVIGFLSSASPDRDAGRLRAFRQGLSETGFIEGRNVAIEYRWADEQNDRLPALAADLVHRQVAVIAQAGHVLGVFAAKAATTTIPIVFVTGVDPVALGLVASLNRPGGNLTGVTTLGIELEPKRLELLHGLIPAARTIGALVNPDASDRRGPIERTSGSGPRVGAQAPDSRRQYRARFRCRLRQAGDLQAGGLVIGTDGLFISRSEHLATLTVRYAMPAIFQFRTFAAAGGLMSYGGRSCGDVSSVRGLRRPYPQGREAGRLACPAGHEGGTDPQPENRQGARPHRAALAARPRRRGDRMIRREFITLLGGAAAVVCSRTRPLRCRPTDRYAMRACPGQ